MLKGDAPPLERDFSRSLQKPAPSLDQIRKGEVPAVESAVKGVEVLFGFLRTPGRPQRKFSRKPPCAYFRA